MRDSPLLVIAIPTSMLLVFAVDLFTPLGIAVWILYVVPVALTQFGRNPLLPLYAGAVAFLLMVFTLFTDEPGIIPWVAQVNRICGMVVVWAIAFLSRGLIVQRANVEREEWIRSTEAEVLAAMQGERPLGDVGASALDVLTRALDAPVAALYATDGSEQNLIATRGLQLGVDVPKAYGPGEGLVGEAARSGRVAVLRDLSSGLLGIRTATIAGSVRHLVVCPLVADGHTEGVLELGLLQAPDDRTLELLERARDGIGIALRSAFYRTRLQALLEETQRQAEELQTQQEELRVTNEELEEQSNALQASQARLEQQQSELEAINAQLETQAAELAQRQEALRQAKDEAERASQYKSQFLANMSHELRTPLNSALILAKLLADNKSGNLTEEQVRFADTIYAAGNNLLTLINDILDLSKIEAGAVEVRPESFAPQRLLDELERGFRPMATNKGLGFTIEVDPDAPDTLVSDPQRLQQILTNLLSNAIKFTERGSVALRVTAPTPDTVSFTVTDTGIGIPPDKLDLIFQAFRQADGSTHRTYGGTGLGLSISRELAHLLGGEVEAASEVGAGSSFTLTLPRRLEATRTRATHDAAPRPAPAVPAVIRDSRVDGTPARDAAPSSVATIGSGAIPDDRHQRHRPGRLILVVEDDLAFARILYDLAHELDFDCVVATSTDEGMALARELSPSGVLLDVALPDGSGLTLLDRLKRNPDTRHIPVHVVSVGDYAQTALELGAIGFAVKPVQREDLVRAIERLEHTLEQRVRRVLVVEDDEQLRTSTQKLLQLEGVVIEAVGTARGALERLARESFDCVVLDLNLPDASGYEILETMAGSEQYSFPPVIVYTGRALSQEDEERLRRFSRSVIVKGARSPERLLDEVTLFLHQVESRLPPDSQRLLRVARERDAFFEGKTILVVEDDVRNIFALSSVFEPRGARIVIARNGREAIDVVRAERPDLVLMDIMMPEMDGLTATRELRKDPELRDVPVIALTAKAMRDDYEECLSAGANDYMTKPIDVDKLISLCRVWIAR
jgi:signal transduction histidine kinase/DNA-binding response OmpR family regulator